MNYPYNPYLSNPYLAQNPYQPVMSSQTVQPYQQPINGIIKVNGPESAMQCQLPPNSTSQPMFDNNGQVFYVVSTDGTGGKTIETFDFSPHVQQQPVPAAGDYVPRSEFQALVDKVNQLIGGTNGTDGPVQAAAE